MSKKFISRKMGSNCFTHMDVVMGGNFPFVEPIETLAYKVDLTNFKNAGKVVLDDIKDEIDKAKSYECVLFYTSWMENNNSHFEDGEFVVDDSGMVNIEMDVLRELAGSKVKYVLVDSPGIRGGKAGEMHNEGDIFLVENQMYAVEYVGGLGQLPETLELTMTPVDVDMTKNTLQLLIEVK